MKQVLFVLLIGLILIAGCNQPAQNTQQENTPAAPNNDAQPETDQGTSPDAPQPSEVQDNSPNNEDALSEFISGLAGVVDYKASYNMSATVQGNSTSAAYDLYLKGNKIRTDTTASSVTSRTWILPDKTVVCTTLQGGSETCQDISSYAANAGTSPLSADEVEANKENYTATPLPPRTIVGEAGNCYSLVMSQDGTQVNTEYCITSDGIMLYTKGTSSDGIWETTATSVRRGVSDAEMTPPAAEPLELPTLPEGYSIPGYS